MIERLQVMEALWDSLLDEESKIESTEWYQDILEENEKEIRLPSDPPWASFQITRASAEIKLCAELLLFDHLI